jgi:hypothetical protein
LVLGRNIHRYIGRISTETSKSTKVQTELYIIYQEFIELRCNINLILKLTYVSYRLVSFNPDGLCMGRNGAWCILVLRGTVEGFLEVYVGIGAEISQEKFVWRGRIR